MLQHGAAVNLEEKESSSSRGDPVARQMSGSPITEQVASSASQQPCLQEAGMQSALSAETCIGEPFKRL